MTGSTHSHSEGITDLRGVFDEDEGYSAEDVNRVFGIIQAEYGLTLICRWFLRDEGLYRGESEFFFKDGSTYYYDRGIDLWLRGESDASDESADPARWRGNRVPDTDQYGPQRCVVTDKRHNCALVDKDAEGN